MAEPMSTEDDELVVSSQEDLFVATTTTTADDTMSESGGDLPEATVTENGENQQQPEEQDDEATASEDEDPDSSPPKNNGLTIHISKQSPPPAKPRPTLKLTLNSKKITTQKSMRIKLKLPTQANTTGVPATAPASPTKVFSSKKTTPSIVSKQATGMGSRRRPVLPSKQVRLPPIASPGLVLPGGKPKAASVFATTMAHAGYTEQQRSNQPHRGSSVRRTVGDLFDTDTRLALHRIELVPSEILEGTKEVNGEKKHLADVFQERLAGRKRPRATTLRAMAPVSLTLPYPDSYRQENLKYLRKVDEREQTIVEWQEAAEMIEELDSDDKNPVIVPPIPQPPEPPKISELQGFEKELSDQRHPIYLPTSKDGSVSARVSHLDPDCFHITQGRYFGLASNNINDPQVCGPNAPGCSGSGGLATATTSTTTSTSGLSGGGMTIILSAGFHCAAAVPIKEPPPSKPILSSTPSSSKVLSPSATATTAAATTLPDTILPTPTTTENANALRMVMMDNEWAEQFRVTIWKAAVYACRTQQYDAPFTGPNGHVYPDLGRAFSGYALVKPCLRCKNNKQGVYHCRVRRKHREADFDGGNSVESLTQYRDTPLELLLETPLEAPAAAAVVSSS